MSCCDESNCIPELLQKAAKRTKGGEKGMQGCLHRSSLMSQIKYKTSSSWFGPMLMRYIPSWPEVLALSLSL